jgi:4-hydroxybenzoyl-CoA thioesterase/acyl-CoA thioester hydrolase
MTVPAFRTTHRVEFSDTDMAGIVHFANFFRFMEAAEHAYLRACGLSVLGQWQDQTITFPRVHASCDFLRPARFEEVLEIEVEVDRIGRSSVHFAFTVHKDGEVIARGKITTVLCRVRDDHTLESFDMPQGLREQLLSGPRPHAT